MELKREQSQVKTPGRHIDEFYIYTREQWWWVGQRLVDGYSLRSLEAFLGVSRNAIIRNVERAGFNLDAPIIRPTLESLRPEFENLRKK